MPRLAWFTPLPPIKSGISRYNTELLPLVAGNCQIDLFVDGPPESFDVPAGMRTFSAFDFLWKQRQRPYDLAVYQLGNAPCHDYMWGYLVRYPGLAVLHDGQLHHARGRMLLKRLCPRKDDYRREFWFNHPEAQPDLAELGVQGLLGSLTYLWPMRRLVVEASRGVVVHNHWLAAEIGDAHPGAAVRVIEMGVPEPATTRGAREAIRGRHGISPDAIVFLAFGRVTPEKRLVPAIRALADVVKTVPNAHLLIAGEADETLDVIHAATEAGVGSHVTLAGYIEDDEIADYVAASDVCLCMRWPTSRETSASWLRCLASGRPTVSTDLVHTVDVPTLDPRNWSVLHTGGDEQPVGVSIDILDEDHSLRIAMRRLAADATLRATLAANAHGLWRSRFTLDGMAAGYRSAINGALHHPAAPAGTGFPAHLHQTGMEHLQELLADAGLPRNPLKPA